MKISRPSRFSSPSLPPKLEAQLDAYGSSSNARSGMRGDGRRNWCAYATVAASSLAAATSADAQIIYSGEQNVTVTLPVVTGTNFGLPNIATKKFSIDGHGFTIGVEESFKNSRHYGAAFVAAQSTGLIGALPSRSNTPIAVKLASGYSLNLLLQRDASRDAFLHVQSSANPRGQFRPGVEGFVGFKALGSYGDFTNLGWLRLSFKNGPGGYPDSITAIDWADQTIQKYPGITVGQESDVVPEPAVNWLTLLGTGAVGVMAWKRRREALARQKETVSASN